MHGKLLLLSHMSVQSKIIEYALSQASHWPIADLANSTTHILRVRNDFMLGYLNLDSIYREQTYDDVQYLHTQNPRRQRTCNEFARQTAA